MMLICPECYCTSRVIAQQNKPDSTYEIHCQCKNIMCAALFVTNIEMVNMAYAGKTQDSD
ncbi:ogr/Delta-like zinc finger family protein [uncultured Vibrio sp.]|uniref:ogr/Delta-like zinc finger family protein n=1 Tax=uncultured Vibrio sp. TaxID=114054 RepID=UPI00263A110D|nr:ogr/Delta-like zinc finger family protein [uncultured Vibrio sp.]